MRGVPGALKLDISETELIDTLLEFAFENGYSIAVWKLPDSSATEIILSSSVKHLHRQDIQLEELPQGFIFSPFDREKSAVFLEADFKFTYANGEVSSPENENETNSSNWLQDRLNLARKRGSEKLPYFSGSDVKRYDKDHFISGASKAIELIEEGVFEKVVPSRNKAVPLGDTFSIPEAFRKLCAAYPHAFVSVISSPQTGTWIGASPEELVRVFDKTIFKTVALAGTQPYTAGINLRNVAWTQKEIEEQALVGRYIISCFKKIRLREYDEHGPKTMVAGNLMHLKSDFTVNMKETNFPQLGSVMLQLLHPTSAVCGMPLEPSLEFLKKYEGYDRGFYSGFLGPVNNNNQIDIFVNLRCMQLLEKKAVVYAGAGVTIDSVPEQEWEETEMKMKTLLSIIA